MARLLAVMQWPAGRDPAGLYLAACEDDARYDTRDRPRPWGSPVPSLLIRAATAADMPALLAWNTAMAWETEHKQLDPVVLKRGIAGVFEQPRRGFYVVAERDGIAVGSLLVTYEWSDWRCGDFWWIQSVYVTPDARRGGLFRALYAEVEQRARVAGAVGLRLYVETENLHAQATYADLGMQQCHYLMYESALPTVADDAG